MPERPIPPPAFAALAAAAQYALCRGGTHGRPDRRARHSSMRVRLILTSIPVAAAVGLFSAAVREFRRHETTVLPMDPARATTMITTGVYRHTRNPIYLADALALIGFAAWLGRARALLPVAAFVITLQEYQIRAEERALAANFGPAYEEYRQRTPRWI